MLEVGWNLKLALTSLINSSSCLTSISLLSFASNLFTKVNYQDLMLGLRGFMVRIGRKLSLERVNDGGRLLKRLVQPRLKEEEDEDFI